MLTFAGFFCNGVTYYVDSETGNDTNDGLAEKSAWGSVRKVNSAKLVPEDRVLFKRNNLFRGTIKPVISGTAERLITYGAYGKGKNPKIFGSKKIKQPLESRMENIEDNSQVSIKNASRAIMHKWKHVKGNEYETPYYVRRKGRIPTVLVWCKDECYIKLQKGKQKTDLKAGEWLYDNNTICVYMPDGGTPDGKHFEVSYELFPFHIHTNVSHIKVENIDFLFGNLNGMSLQGTGTDIQIIKCSVFFNGNDGINGHGDMTDILIDGCKVKNNGQGWGIGGAAGDGISFHNRCTGVIRNCIIENNDKGGIYNIEESVFLSENNILKNNFINLVAGGSSTKEHYFVNNICIQERKSRVGVRIGGNECSAKVFFYNNVLYGNPSMVGLQVQLGKGFLQAKNNIIVGWNIGIKKISGEIELDYNDVWNNKINYLNIAPGLNSISLNPMFKNSTKDDFLLKSGSPCINKGCLIELKEPFVNEKLLSINSAKNIGLTKKNN